MSMSKNGTVYLVGAGPGDLGLVTLRAKECIENADVIVYDHLANPETLSWARDDAEIVYAGKEAGGSQLSQQDINAVLIGKAREGKQIVRLKGGDPFVFGRGAEEAQAIADAGIPFEIVPGITSAIAGPAYAGIPMTHREHNSHVTFFTGHEDPAKGDSAIDYAALAKLGGTQVMLMGVERLGSITNEMLNRNAEARRAQRFASRARSLCHDRKAGNAYRHSFRYRPKGCSQRFQSAGGGSVWRGCRVA